MTETSVPPEQDTRYTRCAPRGRDRPLGEGVAVMTACCPDGCPRCIRCGVHCDAHWWSRRSGLCSTCHQQLRRTEMNTRRAD